MRQKKNNLRIEGTVQEVLPNATFRIKVADNHEVLAHVSGKMRMYYVKLAKGDKVLLELSFYDLSRGRILKKL